MSAAIFRGAYASRVLAKASRLCELPCASATRSAFIFSAIHIAISPFRRDAETNTRDAYAPRKSLPHLSNIHCI